MKPIELEEMKKVGHATLIRKEPSEQEACFPWLERSPRHYWRESDSFYGTGAKMRRIYECVHCGARTA